jgi:hypothetical protein
MDIQKIWLHPMLLPKNKGYLNVNRNQVACCYMLHCLLMCLFDPAAILSKTFQEELTDSVEAAKHNLKPPKTS